MAVNLQHEWPSEATLASNAGMLLVESRIELARLEQRYGFATSQVRSMVAAGTLEQTAEICHWLLVDEVIQSVSFGQST